ncbi:MAG TPA: OB-fold domain-containing protein [Candidatus Binataceae bacterium]|jgi:uncharacterized OB-fold protein|nr:OB-fold domain-containing protein [Candidatus Binataceae bacterium]
MAQNPPYYLPEGLPAPKAQRDGMDAGFWEAARRHELVVQRCRRCETFQFGPEWICHKCLSGELGWHRLSGRGRLYTWVRSWNPVHPALKDAGPFIIAVIELPDAGNVRMAGNLLGNPMLDAPFDAEVEAVFEDHPGATLVQWRLVNG